ncbi:hypothetical protein E4U60_002294 [Claviceps pazoutovae]|uniref:Uncharacterized protein n=1 Tax=Claviceps pazoutovae TaxID=1649127 RepID=A0A9P7MIY2_9HYPO|nr:hypothetical protein E4U60_002294 [Claviceps pazoutovae]
MPEFLAAPPAGLSGTGRRGSNFGRALAEGGGAGPAETETHSARADEETAEASHARKSPGQSTLCQRAAALSIGGPSAALQGLDGLDGFHGFHGSHGSRLAGLDDDGGMGDSEMEMGMGIPTYGQGDGCVMDA